ncbi:hypothetical protein F441_10780 [Phytophthora nicotianae CJ01A1]|uniref:Uncharacterized protein n=1 Tax=Phytophthora nicotianae CJ01A1 TaxID=1317063 RepID=W2WXF3_PHYNI|nr:hypothetical protein F441_10780 [Phytophthora nicotianae CJ01A1]
MENRERSLCEKVKTRKYTRLKPKVGFAIDAWTEDGTHFVAGIGVTETDKYLLCFSTLTDESDMGSDAIIELLDDVLDTYEIHASQLCFYVCDHPSINVALANKTLVPMIGCVSYQFNLAVQALMREDDDILDKVHDLMVKLYTIKNRHHLREADALMPVYRNTTRWISTFSMIDRYSRIYSKLDRIDDQLADFIPTPRENVRLKALFEDLKNLESVNMKLQTTMVSLLDVRALSSNLTLNGILNLMAGKENILTRGERAAVVKLQRTTDTVATNSQEEGGDGHQILCRGCVEPEGSDFI